MSLQELASGSRKGTSKGLGRLVERTPTPIFLDISGAAEIGSCPAKSTNQLLQIIFLWFSSAELAIERVADRVRMGGHSVPADTIRRRYRACVRNFFGLYERLASTWRLYDNSGDSPKLIAARLDITPMNVYDEDIWASVARQRTDNES